MRGDDRVLEFLNEQLTAELTAINQYFLHAKMQENFGWVKIARHTRAESVDEMRHAETLTDRILFLDGLPNYQRLFALRIGQTITQMLESDMLVETEAVDRLRRGIEYMRGIGDVTSANIFEAILADEEQHIDYLETQLGLITQLGEPLYLAQLVEQPSDLRTAARVSRSRGQDSVRYGDRRRVLVPAGYQR
jgi:bacterioferritin